MDFHFFGDQTAEGNVSIGLWRVKRNKNLCIFFPLLVLFLREYWIHVKPCTDLFTSDKNRSRIIRDCIREQEEEKKEIQSWNPILSDVDPTAPDKLCRISFKQAREEGKKRRKEK